MAIRVVLVDDHHMVREALCDSINQEEDLEVVAQAGDGSAALAIILEQKPDVVVLDIALPEMSGIDLTREMTRRNMRSKIVALSGYRDRIFVEEMFRAGAQAYVAKAASTDDLCRAIRAVYAGHSFVSPEVTAQLVSRIGSGTATTNPPLTVLTQREREVLGLLAAGRRTAEIAHTLEITSGTVEVHRRNIRAKLGIRAVAQLTRYAIREGLIPG